MARQFPQAQYSAHGINYRYSFVFRKWAFEVKPGNEFLCACRGNAQAVKVASIIAGAVKRSGEMDGLARANIARIAV